VLEVTVSYAYFTGTLNILNVDADSSIHANCKSSSGGYGHIYKITHEGNTYALKCLTYAENNFQTIFSNTVMEYFLLKVASILEVGPSMSSPFGFDLVIYRNCIEFTMEFCKYSPSEYLEIDLKTAMHKLHNLRIIHFDIKP
jgi:serine/threonine protein kinase